MVFAFIVAPMLAVVVAPIIGSKTGNSYLKTEKVFSAVKAFLYFFAIFYIALEFYAAAGLTLKNTSEMTGLAWKYRGELVTLLGGISLIEFMHNISIFFKQEN